MPEKSLSVQPTSSLDFAWSPYKSYTRSEFLEMYPLGTNSVVSIFGTAIASEVLSKFPFVAQAYDVFSQLTNIKKQEMVNGIYTKFVNNANYTGVKISSKFSGYHKGSQGWFWVPANDYRVIYIYG